VDFLLKLPKILTVFPDSGEIPLLNDDGAVIQVTGANQPTEGGFGIGERLIDFAGLVEDVNGGFHVFSFFSLVQFTSLLADVNASIPDTRVSSNRYHPVFYHRAV